MFKTKRNNLSGNIKGQGKEGKMKEKERVKRGAIER